MKNIINISLENNLVENLKSIIYVIKNDNTNDLLLFLKIIPK